MKQAFTTANQVDVDSHSFCALGISSTSRKFHPQFTCQFLLIRLNWYPGNAIMLGGMGCRYNFHPYLHILANIY